MANDDEWKFHPDDIAYLEQKFARIKNDSSEGFSVEFIMTKLAAKDMIQLWMQAIFGDAKATEKCMANYGYIMEEIMFALEQDEENPTGADD